MNLIVNAVIPEVEITVELRLTLTEAEQVQKYLYRGLEPVATTPMSADETKGQTIVGDVYNTLYSRIRTAKKTFSF